MADAKKTVLYERHTALAAKSQIVPFAGWLMPLWFKSINDEHTAVRKTAGLFDCTHMAILKIAGKNALNFLNTLTTNDVSMLKPGRAQYSYILNFEGDIIDDVIIYCISNENFMVVANAANEQKVKGWINNAAHTGTEIKDLKDSSLPDARVDIALQGPASAECLKDIFGVDFGGIKPFTFIQVENIIISATGYTGAKAGFELFVHSAKARQLWDIILEKGRIFGIIPCGLGARDSLRIEAGLPLYGHELDGQFNISPFQAGYGWAVKLQKNSFIGKEAIVKKAADYDSEIARLKFDGGKGIRPIRQFDGILNENGICIGYVLSCAGIGDKQIALALIEKQDNIIGNPLGVYYLARNAGHIQQGRLEKVRIGDKLNTDLAGKAAERFEKF
jgi:glycine hydroxymethyltransferase